MLRMYLWLVWTSSLKIIHSGFAWNNTEEGWICTTWPLAKALSKNQVSIRSLIKNRPLYINQIYNTYHKWRWNMVTSHIYKIKEHSQIVKVDLIKGCKQKWNLEDLPNEFQISFKSRCHPIPVCSLRLLQSCIDEKGSSKASAERKHVISTRSNAKTHLFNMPSNLTATKHLIT